MRCDYCENYAMFVVYSDEVRFLCKAHLERFDEFPFERVGESPFVRDSLNEAERVLATLLAGEVVRFVHPRYPEVHWAVWDRERECFVEKVVNSLTGEILLLSRFEKLQDYFEKVGKAIASGWLVIVANIRSEAILGGER